MTPLPQRIEYWLRIANLAFFWQRHRLANYAMRRAKRCLLPKFTAAIDKDAA